jgi:hypothetical protein
MPPMPAKAKGAVEGEFAAIKAETKRHLSAVTLRAAKAA